MDENLYLKTLYREPKKEISRPPVWFMRQAGRCLADYRELRKQYSFRELMYTPKLASEVTLQPIKELKVDAAILFSDILVIPEALGQDLIFDDRTGPQLTPPLSELSNPSDYKEIFKTSSKVLAKIYRAIEQIITDKKKLAQEIPLIGFCGAPLTLFLYMWEGLGQNKNPQNKFANGVQAIYQQRELVEKILDDITEMTIIYAQEQKKSGVEAFQIFESWAGVIPFSLYNELVLPRVHRIAKSINKDIPVVFFPLNIGVGYFSILETSYSYFSGIGVDWQTSLETLMQHNPHHLVLQGNLNPTTLTYTPFSKKGETHFDETKAEQHWQIVQATLEKEYDSLLKDYQKNDDFYWIFNLGHGVIPNTDERILKKVVEWVKG